MERTISETTMSIVWLSLGLIFTSCAGLMAYRFPDIAIITIVIFDGLSITWVAARSVK